MQFVNEDKTNIDVNQYPDKEIALTDLYVNDPYQLVFNNHQINTEIEGYTLSKIVDANDAQKEYPLTTIEQGYVDITLSQNITKLQLVYTKNPEPAQQPENNQAETDNQQPSEEQEESSEEDGQQEEQAKEDIEAVKEDTESEKVSMPEQVLSAVAGDGAVITIMAPEGSVPENSTVVAEPVENDSIAQSIEDALNEENKTLNEYKAYDITILDKDGNKIQPEKDVQVSITGVSVSGEEKAVFHIDDSNKVEKVSDTSVGQTTLFNAESFSIYVLSGADQGNAGQPNNRKYTMEVGQQITLAEEDLYAGGKWSVDKKGQNVVRILNASGGSNGFLGFGRVDPSVEVNAIGTGDAQIIYTEDGRRPDKSTFYIHVDERDGNYTITFKANGGQGEDRVWETEKTNITLPEPEDIGITNEGKMFIGWSEDETGKGNTYVANIQYPSTSDGTGQLNRDVTLYAIWLDEDEVATKGVTAYFYIRKDGEIQWEPAGYDTNLYYPTGSAKDLEGKLKQPIAVNNNLTAVEANLAEIPSDQEIIDVLKQYGVNYNPETQTIQWYVIKARADAPGYWNVDGVIVNKEEHLVTYHPNGGTTEVPGSLTYVAGTNVDVNFDRIPTRAGYDFIGWDENPNAKTPTYTQNGTRNFNMPDEDVTLYAIWKERTDTKFTVEHYIQQYDGTYTQYDLKEEAGTTGSTVKDDDYKLEDFEFEGQKYTYSPGAVDDITEAKVDAEGNTVLKLYYNLVSERKDYDDGIISTGDNTDDSEDELMQGKINIEVYLDGTLHHKGEVKFKYYQHNAVDLYVNCDNNYYLNAIYAIQTDVPSLAEDITATSVDNVEGDTTVYIYVTSKYTAKYTLNGEESSIVDNNKYTIPNYGINRGNEYSVYENNTLEDLSKIDLKDIPIHSNAGYKYDGWYIGEQKFNDKDEFDVFENQTLANDKVFVFNANTEIDAAATDKVSYKAEANGTVTNAEDTFQIVTAEGLTGSTAQAKPGYKFVGWFKDDSEKALEIEDDEDPATLTAAEVEVNLNKDGDGNYTATTFTAKFEIDAAATDKVSYKAEANGTVTNAEDTFQIVTAEGLTGSTAQAKPGYKFVGWFKDDSEKALEIEDDEDPATLTAAEVEVNLNKDGDGNYTATTFTAKFERDLSDISVTPYKGTYDGKGHNVTVKGIINGDKVEYSTDGEKYSDNLSFVDVTNGKQKVYVRVTNGDQSTVVESYVLITPAPVTVKSGSAKKVYDGTPLTNTKDTSISGLVNGEKVTLKTEGTITDVGSALNTVTIDWGSVKETNYTVTYKFGTLTVTAQSIDPSDPSYLNVKVSKPENKVYDGKDHKWIPEVTLEDGTPLVEGTDYTVTYSTENFKDVQKIKVTISGTGNYSGTVTRTYRITRKPITITTDSAIKVYDGTALTADGRVEGIVDGETYGFVITGKRTEVGSSENAYKIEWTGSAKERNYKITEDLGTLTVVPQSIDPEDPTEPEDPDQPVYAGITVDKPEDKVYDGQEHKWTPTVTLSDGTVLDPENYEVSYDTEDFVNVTGKITVTITGTGNYAGTVTRTYQITPRAVTITSADDSKVYDGTPLTNGNVSVTEGSLVSEEDITFKATGSQTEVGSSANTIEVTYANEQMEKNYDVTLVEGTLTVTEKPAEKPEDSDSDQDSEKTDGEDTAAATNVGIFASLATSALAGMGILAALKKRRKN